VSGIAQKMGAVVPAARGAGLGVINDDSVAYAADIGANVNVAGFGLTGYYYAGQGIGTTIQFRDGYSLATTNAANDTVRSRDSDGGYVQATYILPTKTKVGISWGQSNLDRSGNDLATSTLVKKNEMTTAGIYHPITKHLNLVAEYSYVTAENQAGAENKNNIGSLGAILFF